ncbi:hypothetical protein [Enterobacter hormaechei]|uniref:hypothetical protein n=1 Tax=Enterobacter hormaechei TaxID=158836 RepID=UPI00198207E0|nr:hypothetical protein [Enterobacter hormaechei]MBN4788249.1 hypothetical protein [Enterobacter hormaechei]
MSNIDKQALRSTSERDWFEDWFKREFHPDKTGPYIKDQLFFAVRAARAPLLDELEAAEKRIDELTEKPIGWTDEQELRDVEKLGCGYLFNANPITPHADPRRVILLYAAAAGKGE